MLTIHTTRGASAQNLRVAAITHRGAVREFNEDAVAINGTVLVGDMDRPLEIRSNADRQLIIVADGMGGHACGDIASRAAIQFDHVELGS